MIQIKELANHQKYICDTSSVYFACVLEGAAAGGIWVDDVENPTFLLVYSNYQGGFQLMGQPAAVEKEEFRSWFYQELELFINEQELDGFEFGADTEELAKWFLSMFSEKEIGMEKQQVYLWMEQMPDVQQPVGYIVEKVNDAFWEKGYKDMDYIWEEVETAYGNRDTYPSSGIAYVAIKDNEIAARATVFIMAGGYANISVDTKEKHRKKGLAAYLTKKTIEDICDLGLKPIWDCTQDNFASQKTAERCGFEKAYEEDVYWFSVEEA